MNYDTVSQGRGSIFYVIQTTKIPKQNLFDHLEFGVYLEFVNCDLEF